MASDSYVGQHKEHESEAEDMIGGDIKSISLKQVAGVPFNPSSTLQYPHSLDCWCSLS